MKLLLDGRGKDEFVFGLKGFTAVYVNALFKKRAITAGVYREGLSAHSLRFSCATHLLSHGADIRFVQRFLSHASISTTVGYTTELVENMRRIHKSFHPRENQMFKEVDEEYRGKWQRLKRELEARVKG